MTRRSKEETAELRGEIIRMREESAKPALIAEELGISEVYVRRVLNEAGFVQHRRQLDEEAIVADYVAGEIRVLDICRKYKISTLKLYQVLADHEVGTNSRKRANAIAIEMAVSRYENEGETPVWKILQDTGVPQPLLHKALHDRNIPLRRKKYNIQIPELTA